MCVCVYVCETAKTFNIYLKKKIIIESDKSFLQLCETVVTLDKSECEKNFGVLTKDD